MAFCSSCGAEMQGSFCGSCGAGSTTAAKTGDTPLEDHVAAALCYLFGFITGIIFLAWSPYNQSKNVRFHAYQSILLTVAWLLVHFMIALFIPFGFRFTLGPLVQIAGMLLWLFMMWKTYTKERIVLPVIGPIAEKQS